MPKSDLAYPVPKAPKTHATLVCVTDQYGCETHIKAGKVLADLTNTHLIVVHISSPAQAGDAETLEYLYSVARGTGAMMQVLYSDDSAKALIKYIKHNKVKNIITGIPCNAQAVPCKLWRKFTHNRFYTVDESRGLMSVGAPQRSARTLSGAPASCSGG